MAQTTEWQQVAQGNQLNINSLPDYESQLAEGQNARVDFNFITPVPSFQVDALRSTLSFAGVTNLQVVSSGNTISVHYTKDPMVAADHYHRGSGDRHSPYQLVFL